VSTAVEREGGGWTTSLHPLVLFFALRLAEGVFRADPRLPPAIYEFVGTLLPLSIGV